MFTGIVTHIVEVQSARSQPDGLELDFGKPAEWTNLIVGESINSDGVCLTVTAFTPTNYTCFLMPETLAVTSFGVKVPQRVNVERALLPADRLGGHFVQGHVDAIGKVRSITQEQGWRLEIDFDAQYQSLVIHKGSIAINGVSLTIAAVGEASLTVAIIPHTLEHTTLGDLQVQDSVNLEFDVLGKYVANHMKAGRDATSE